MAAFDLGAKAGSEPALEMEHDSGLLRESPVECRTTHGAQVHEDLAKRIAVLDLSVERSIELVIGDFPLLREQRSKQGPIAAVVVHVSPILLSAAGPLRAAETDDLSQDARGGAEWNP